MYRHFAVITVALSCVVAMFADGDARELAAQARQLETRRAPKPPSAGIADHRSRPRKAENAFASEGSLATDTGASNLSGFIPASMTLGPAPVILEIDPQVLARMTPGQREAYLRQLEEERRKRMEQAPFQPTAQQVSALAAQSAARSGANSID